MNPSAKRIKILCLVLGISFLILFFREHYPRRIYERLTGQTPATNSRSNYWLNKDDVFKSLPIDTNSIVFIGTSLTEVFQLQEIFPTENIKNRGITGDMCAGILLRSDDIIEARPKKIFLEMGINDVLEGISKDSIFHTFVTISQKIKTTCPTTKFYIQSILPVYEGRNNTIPHAKKANADLAYLNNELKSYCLQNKITFVPLFEKFAVNGSLDPRYSQDGVHLLGKGYDLWAQLIGPYIKE